MADPVQSLTMQKQVSALKKEGQAPHQQRETQLRKACRDFESIFVNYMMKQMRQTVTKDGVIGSSQAQQLYTSMLDSEVAKNISQERGMGLAAMLYKQMSGNIDEDFRKK
jgi:flagellar protein FlgJ